MFGRWSLCHGWTETATKAFREGIKHYLAEGGTHIECALVALDRVCGLHPLLGCCTATAVSLPVAPSGGSCS